MIQKTNDKPAAIYLRRSTDKQEQSIGDQRQELKRYAEEHGFDIVTEYVDDAISGTSAVGRPGFQGMIHDASLADRRFDHVLVYDVKRFSRGSLDEVGYYRHLLSESGVEVHYAAEGFSGQPTDDIMRALKQYLAREESRDLSRVTIRGQLSSVKAGWWCGGMPPYGYDLEYVDSARRAMHRLRYLETGKKEMLDLNGNLMRTLERGQRLPKGQGDKARLVLSTPDRVEVVREIVKMYTQRAMGFRAIASELNGRRIPSPKNGKRSETTHAGWSQSTVRSLLFNPLYTGDAVWNRRTGAKFHRIANERAVPYENGGRRTLVWNQLQDHVVVRDSHPAIIDRETWAEIERLRAEKKRKAGAFRGGRAKESLYVLSGLIRCGRCGHNYVGQSVNKGRPRKDGSRVRTRYYICGGYLTRGTHACQRTPIPAESIEATVWGQIQRQVDAYFGSDGIKIVREVLTRELCEAVAKHALDPRQIKSRTTQIDRDIKRLIGSITSINAKYIDHEIVSLEREKETLERQLAQAKVRETSAASIDAVVSEISSYMQDFKSVVEEGTLAERKEFIRLFVEGIELEPTGKKAVLRIKKFPAPSELDTGKLSFGVVAGTGFEPATFGL